MAPRDAASLTSILLGSVPVPPTSQSPQALCSRLGLFFGNRG
jgi:hypothetical protein